MANSVIQPMEMEVEIEEISIATFVEKRAIKCTFALIPTKVWKCKRT